jgi:hypothetical protein
VDVNVNVEITLLIAVLGCAVSVAGFLLGRTTAAKNAGIADGELKADIRYIKNGVDKQEAKLDGIIVNYEEVKLEIESIKGRLDTLEQKVNYFHGV